MILDGRDEELIGGTNSGSHISDVEDYCQHGDIRPPRDVRTLGNQPLPAEQYQSDSDESSQE